MKALSVAALVVVIVVTVLAPSAAQTPQEVAMRASKKKPGRVFARAQTFGIVYRWFLPSEVESELSWLAEHYDFFVCGSTDAHRDQLRAMTNVPMIRYINLTNVAKGDNTPEWQSMVWWCQSNGVPIESMFLHADGDFIWRDTYYSVADPPDPPIPGLRNRIPCLAPERWLLNVASPQVQAWSAVVAREQMALGPYGGLMVDNGWSRVPWSDLGITPFGIGTIEGVTDTEWRDGLAQCLRAAREATGGTVIVNTGNYILPSTDALVDACDGFLGELWIRPSRELTMAQVNLTRAREREGKICLLHARNEPVDGDENRGKILGLAEYYLMAGPNSYLFCGENYGREPYSQNNWFGALDVAIGRPLMEPYVIDDGQDQRVWRRDYENGTVLVRPLPTWNANTTDGGWVVTPRERGKLWRPLRADGTFGERTDRYYLRNAEAAIFVPCEMRGRQ